MATVEDLYNAGKKSKKFDQLIRAAAGVADGGKGNKTEFFKYLNRAAKDLIKKGGTTSGLVEITRLYSEIKQLVPNSIYFTINRKLGGDYHLEDNTLQHSISVKTAHIMHIERQRHSEYGAEPHSCIDVICFGYKIDERHQVDLFRPWIFADGTEELASQYFQGISVNGSALGAAWDGACEHEHMRQLHKNPELLHFSILASGRPIFFPNGKSFQLGDKAANRGIIRNHFYDLANLVVDAYNKELSNN